MWLLLLEKQTGQSVNNKESGARYTIKSHTLTHTHKENIEYTKANSRQKRYSENKQ